MKTFKKIVCTILVVLMLVTSAPMQGFVGLDIDLPDWFSHKAEAANIGTYCATVAVDYAKKYALSYNKEWYFYVNGGDCANFVSQSLFVAGVPMTSNWHSYDYNSTAYVMNNNYTWIRAQELMDYLISIGGVRIDNPSPSDFSLGDAVFYNWNGGRIDHSAIVTAIEGGVPKVSCHSTPEMESKLNAHWTLGKNKSCAVLIKLGGETCVANNAPDYDIYKLHTSTGLYSNPGSGFITTVSYRHTVRVIEKINFGGTTWGKFNYKGTWGWIDLSKGTYKGHFDRMQASHSFGGWYTVKQATCVDKGLERRDCSRCGYQEEREILVGGHVGKSPATCTTAEVCKACGITITSALGHDFTDWKLITAPTCIQVAVYERTCMRCGRVETKNGDKGNHNYMANVTTPGCTTSGGSTMKCTYCGDSYIEDSGNVWSGWTTEVKSEMISDPKLYETKKQYRYIDKQTQEVNGTPNANYTISGWSVESKESYWGDYGNWSGWQDAPVTETDTRDVEERTVEVSPGQTLYRYGRSYNGKNHSTFCPHAYHETALSTYYDDWTGWSTTQANLVDNKNNGINNPDWSCSICNNTWFTYQFSGSSKHYYWVETKTSEPEYKTQYRYRDRQMLYNYVFYTWPAWTDNWQDTKVTASSTRQVQERTLYRYKLAALGHNFGAPEVIAPTCTEKGHTEKTCQRCSFAYKYDYKNALGHNWGNWYTVIEAKPGQAGLERKDCLRCGIFETRGHNLVATVTAPICTEKGYTTYKCSDDGCKVEYVDNYVDALGHDMRDEETEVIKYPTCTEKGEEKITCKRCDYFETKDIEPLGHDYDRDDDGDVDAGDAAKTVDVTCLKDGYRYFECENASEHNYRETIAAVGHDMCDWIEVVPNTCGDEGYFWRECQNEFCDISQEIRGKSKRYYEEKDNYFLVHQYGDIIEVDATCTEDGYATQTCEICGDIILYEGEDALDHDWSDWYELTAETCTQEGIDRKTCQRCGIHDDIVTPPLGHDDISEVFNATCIAEAGVKNTCQRCGRVEIIYDGDVDPNAHDMGEWYLEIAPTCTEVGYNRRDCQRSCGYFEREPINVLGHDYKESSRTEPDCENDGEVIHKCQNDGCDSETKEILIKLGHEFGTTVVDPTCTSDGYTLYDCQRENCDYSEKRDEKEKLGHNMGEWSVVTTPTATTKGEERRDCTRCDYFETREIPVLEKLTATFVADGKVIAKIDFYAGDTELSYVPDVPGKDRYDGKWEDYLPLGDKDITINAVYTLIPPDGLSEIETKKEAIPNEETRDVTIRLSASSDAETIITETTEKTPLDIVLVVDQSGSMVGTKLKELKDSVTAISDLIFEEAKLNDVDHRLAIVGFAMGSYTQDSRNYPAFMNSEVLSVKGGPVQYSSKPSEKLNNAYKNALVLVNDNGVKNDIITNAIEAIDANGATAANIGLTMAANIFAQNSIEGTNRNRVVIFMTDGEPTSYSSYDETNVANPAIKQANQLKSKSCGATIYSVGIDCNTNINKKFLNAVSSNYDSVESMQSKISTETNDFFFYSDNVEDLKEMFSEIVIRNMINTTDFKDITLVDTISKYFTLTTQQEAALRESVIAEYGISNADIIVTRNDDSTTTIKIMHLDPKPITGADGKVVYKASVEFTASANANALVAGTYETNTEDAGVILSGAELYEKLFDKQTATFTEDKGAAIFKINGEIYQITSVEIGGKVLPPDYRIEAGYSFSDWDVPEDYILNGGSVEFNADLDKTKYTVAWNIGEETITQEYYPDDYIYAPEVDKVLNGLTFMDWNTKIPATMPEKNLEFTACYAVHTHAYITETTRQVTCTESGVLTHTCYCGDTYTETVPAVGGEHDWLAITGVAALDNLSLEEFRCNKCNAYMSKALVYEVVKNESAYSEGQSQVIYDLSMYDVTGKLIQPGTKVKISMPVPNGMENANSITVYRIDNGKRVKLTSDYSRRNQTITFETDHFCEFVFISSYDCESGFGHPDENGDSICDDCLKSFRCSMCDFYEKHADDTLLGKFIAFIHYFIHMARNISLRT